MISSDNRQIQQLIEQGFTPEQAAAALGLEPESGPVSVYSGKEVKLSLAQIVEAVKPEMVKVLIDIAKYGENESARVASAKILLTGQGIMPDISASEISRRLANMKRIQSEVKDVEVLAA
jgi:hypothetical protein